MFLLYIKAVFEEIQIMLVSVSTNMNETNSRISPVGCPASHRPAAWPHERCPQVWTDPTDPSLDTDLQETPSVSWIHRLRTHTSSVWLKTYMFKIYSWTSHTVVKQNHRTEHNRQRHWLCCQFHIFGDSTLSWTCSNLFSLRTVLSKPQLPEPCSSRHIGSSDSCWGGNMYFDLQTHRTHSPGAQLSTKAPRARPVCQSLLKLVMGSSGNLFWIHPSSLCFGVFCLPSSVSSSSSHMGMEME